MSHRFPIDLSAVVLVLLVGLVLVDAAIAREITRPEEIKDLSRVTYDLETYARLADLWKKYYEVYPSEYAYANWMKAADYAADSHFVELLDNGLEKYEANPVLLYLKALVEPHGPTARARLERAAALDPDYTGPWFALVPQYMMARDEERVDLALQRILKSGSIPDEVLDQNYNMILPLKPNAILITNGDNDTFPGWILTRILKFRSDVAIVNRSLLLTEWYPLYAIELGLPRFVHPDQLQKLRGAAQTTSRADQYGSAISGNVSDTLVKLLVASAERAGRPVYFANGLQLDDELKPLAERGRLLGLATLVTPSEQPYQEELKSLCTTWLSKFRTAGLLSWRLAHAGEADAGRLGVQSYAASIGRSLPDIKKYAPELRRDLFNWYLQYVEPHLRETVRHNLALTWSCYGSDIEEIEQWSRKQGLMCPDSSRR